MSVKTDLLGEGALPLTWALPKARFDDVCKVAKLGAIHPPRRCCFESSKRREGDVIR